MNQSTSPTNSISLKDPCLQELQKLLGERLSMSNSVREQHGRDESFHASAPPEAVTFAECNEEPRFYISFADCIRLRTGEDHQEYSDSKLATPGAKVYGYGGLYIQVMNHATPDLADQLIERLDKFGREMK